MAVVYIGIPREERVYSRALDHVELVAYKLSDRGFLGGILKTRISAVDEGRNQLVDKFLERPHATHLLMLDSDQTFPPDIGYRLLQRDKDVITALYFTKGDYQLPVVYRHAGKERDRLGRDVDQFQSLCDEVHRFLKEHQVSPAASACIINADDGLMRIDGCGCGAMLVRRQVFEKVGYPWFRLGGGVGEDFDFCLKAAEAGYEIWADCSVICGHIDVKVVGQAQFQAQYPVLEEMQKHLGDGLEEDLAEYTELDKEAVKARLANTPHLVVAQKWREAAPRTPEEVRAFYSSTEEYLFDLAAWNASDSFRYLVGILPDTKGKRVLDFGAGLGSLSFLLQGRGAAVDYLELPGILYDFACFRAMKLDVLDKLGWLRSLDDARERYDVAIAIDVLEHLVDLPAELTRISRALRPGGVLFFHNNFGQQEAYPMHVDWGPKWPAILSQAGLVQETPNTARKVRGA